MNSVNTAFLIYPNQLYEQVFEQNKDFIYFIIEDTLFFKDTKHYFNFHKKKLLLHRASMKYFYQMLKNKGFKVEYIDFSHTNHPKFFLKKLRTNNFEKIVLYDPTDYILSLRLKKYCDIYNIKLQILESVNFITTLNQVFEHFKDKKHFSMNSFYIYQRKRLNILMQNQKPVGGNYSFDVKNRNKLPKNITLVNEIKFDYDFKNYKSLEECASYINKNFNDNYGDTNNFNYPVTHEQASKQLEYFLEYKFNNFGPYEDAIAKDEVYLFHSNLSSSLNIGLLSPKQVIDSVLNYYEKSKITNKPIPIESVEGFIRQIIGWREFMRATYVLKGSQIRNSNYLNHFNKIDESFYNATTGIYVLDYTIKKVVEYAYCHHIERLMILGNLMLLLQKDPNDIYKWFMEMFIDAYDWVMVPNVYSMSQFSDGGLITTKPYFSSSNYILKMSDYKKDTNTLKMTTEYKNKDFTNYKNNDWCIIWDSLFYNFILKHREIIKKNPRLSILLKNLDNKTDDQIKEIIKISSRYI